MRILHSTTPVMMLTMSLLATVLGAPQFNFNIPVPGKPAGLYELPSASHDFVSIPKPHKPSGLYELPSSASSPETRVVLGGPILTAANNPVSNAVPLPITASDEPLMPYEMSYNIMDGINSVYHTREEVQTDTDLTGSYSYLRPDGIYQTVEYYVDATGYHANVIESKEAPVNLQKVESSRAKYEVKLPKTASYLIDVDDAELREYIQNALDFEPAVIPQFEPAVIPQESQVSQVAQASNPPQLTAHQPTASQEVLTPVLSLLPPSNDIGGYSYPVPARPFNPLAG